MPCTTSQHYNVESKVDFRLLFLEDSYPGETNSVSSNLNDLERLLTRIHLMNDRVTANPQATTRRSTASPAVPPATGLPEATLPITPAKPTWHSLPTEIRLRIYHHYFNDSHYTIHNSSSTSTCLTRPASTFWRTPASPSTVHSSHINLFLASPEIIYTAHSIWLSTSTFSFGNCIARDSNALWQLNLPKSLLTQVRLFEADKEKVINLIKVLGEWKRRIGIVDYIGTARGREEVPFVLRCRGSEVEFGTYEVFSGLYRAGLYGMRLEYTRGRKEEKEVERGRVLIQGYDVDLS